MKSNKDSYLFRKIDIDKDIEAIYKLNKSFAEYESRLNAKINKDYSFEEFRKVYEDKLRAELSALFLVETKEATGKKIIGYCLGWIEQTTFVFNREKRGKIAECFILEDYRNKGLGRKLIEHLLSWFKENDIRWITVEVLEDNESKKFWEKMGFRITSLELQQIL